MAAGKSSLLKTISKAVTPRNGQIIYQDKKLSQYPPKILAQKIAYLAQVHTSPPDIDVRTLVSYGRYPHSKFGRGLTARDGEVIDKALSLTGLESLQNQILSTLSGGERQRAWIAMTICQEPEILVLDEPTTYLDISYQVEVLELVRKLNRELGITIIMVLHDLNLAARYSDRLYAIKDRRSARTGRSRAGSDRRKSIIHFSDRGEGVSGRGPPLPLLYSGSIQNGICKIERKKKYETICSLDVECDDVCDGLRGLRRGCEQ